MAEFAVIWTTDKGYFPGTNASLNAFEFYGNDVDIYILTWGNFLSDEYKKQWENVSFVEINRTDKGSGWHLRFSDILYGLENLFQKYKAVLIWGADVCLVSNIMVYFDICASTSRVILGTNEHGSHDRNFKRLSGNWPYKHTWDVPFADVPWFVPSDNTNHLDVLISYQNRPGHTLSKMDGLNYAIRDSDTNPIEVAGERWIQNVPYKIKLYEDRATKTIYFDQSSTMLKAFHRKYWNAHICESYLPGSGDRSKQISRSNKMLFNRMYNFFNKDCRVKWTEGLDVWDG